MLIDFFKAVHHNVCAESLLHNRDLQFVSTYNRATSELYPTCLATVHNLKLTIKGKNLIIEGSLHKYSNLGKHNYSDFTYSDLLESIDKICSKLQLDAKDFILQQLEFGINVQLPFKTNTVLNNLLIYQGNPICKGAIKNGDFRSVDLHEYRLKAYDKALQYGLDSPLMRFEVHITKMRQIQSTNIKTLDDLRNQSKLVQLAKILINRWDNVLLFDWTIDLERLKESDKIFYYQVQNKKYWLELNKNQRNKMKERYKKIVLNHSKNVQQEISSKMLSKIDELKIN